MRARPILMSAPMVQALLAGRKSQTRRILKNPEYYGCLTGDCPHWQQAECNTAMQELAKESPHGVPGDLLWVRETCFVGRTALSDNVSRSAVIYAADCTPQEVAEGKGTWRPSIFMPRYASRLTLELTGVRVERLRNLSRDDALAEGIAWSERTQGYSYDPADGGPGFHGDDPCESYWKLWDFLNGEGESWKSPWSGP
jgi:hypothetical protein